jgi:hypothetical protein
LKTNQPELSLLASTSEWLTRSTKQRFEILCKKSTTVKEAVVLSFFRSNCLSAAGVVCNQDPLLIPIFNAGHWPTQSKSEVRWDLHS